MPQNTPEPHPPQRAGIYCRISLASIGDTTKTDDQERICRDLCHRLGWEVTEVYTDKSRSAWQRNRKRPAWDAMLADVERGRINAIAVYHGDRLIRRHEDLSKLLELARLKGVRLASPTGTRDLDNADDQFILEIETSMAKRESANTSRRRKQQYERWWREGRVRPGGWGGRPYGFATDGVTLIPAEAEAIRGAAGRILAGESAKSVARGMVTPAGNPFTHNTLTRLLARPRYAGLMPDGENRAAWPPILDRATWEEVRAAVEARGALNPGPTNTRKWLLSGIATCSECGHGLTIRTESRPGKVPGYRCVQPGCRKVQRSVAHLDEYVITRVLARLNNPENPRGRFAAIPQLAAEFGALTAQRAEVEALLADHTKGRADLLMRRLDSIDRRLAELRELAAGAASARVAAAHTGITREEFDALPLSTRRALVAACFTVTVLPASKRGPGFRTEDVRLGVP